MEKKVENFEEKKGILESYSSVEEEQSPDKLENKFSSFVLSNTDVNLALSIFEKILKNGKISEKIFSKFSEFLAENLTSDRLKVKYCKRFSRIYPLNLQNNLNLLSESSNSQENLERVFGILNQRLYKNGKIMLYKIWI